MALINDLTAIGNAIREKTGRTDLIPLADMPNVIKSISGGGTTGKRIVTGTFSLDADSTQPIITHDCGFVPSVFLVYPISEYAVGTKQTLACVVVNANHYGGFNIEGLLPHFVLECQDTRLTWQGASATHTCELTETTAKMCFRTLIYPWKQGFEYGWIAYE